MQPRPTILCIAGHDPTGGAGIQADIETINELGGHCCTIITALTVQNSENLYSFQPVSPELIQRQFRCLVEDFQIQAIKIGMIGSINLLDSLSGLLDQLPETPVILDPVLSAGGGASVSSNAFIEKLISSLLPKTTLITPNIPEAQQLSGKKSADDCAASLMQLGCKNILITGTHEDGINVVNRLYSESAGKLALPGPRLPQEYHGSGCTLSSAISFYIASGHSLTNALKLAQEFTFNSLQQADRPGRGQFFPIRNRKRWI